MGAFSVVPGSKATVTFTPMPGYKLTALNGAAIVPFVNPTTQVSYAGKDANSGALVNLPYAGAVKVQFTVAATTMNISGTFTADAAVSAGADQNVTANTLVTLNGSVTPATSPLYSWTQSAGPTVALSNINVAGPTFTPSVNGTYTFKLTASNAVGVGMDSVNVYVSGGAIMPINARTMCVDCHAGQGVGGGYAANGVYANWSTGYAPGRGHRNSFHPANCNNCHIGAETGAHPGVVNGNACQACHAGTHAPANHTAFVAPMPIACSATVLTALTRPKSAVSTATPLG